MFAFWTVSILILFLMIISLVIFLPEIKNRLSIIPSEEVLNIPEVKINFASIDSDLVKNLELFEDIRQEFIYSGQDSAGKKVNGKIQAISREDAESKLLQDGITITTLEESAVGRKEPFKSY